MTAGELPAVPRLVQSTEWASWSVEVWEGSAASLHAADLLGAASVRRRVVVQLVDRPAWVLGSAQRPEVLMASARRRTDSVEGADVVVRRSGGGIVALAPDAQVWVDVVIPADDELWADDVDTAALWLGHSWADALAEFVDGDLIVHHGGVTDRRLGRLVCFAALGPGEVASGGRKLVGISQRRTRRGARFQCVVPLRWSPSELLRVLDPDVVGAQVMGDLAEAL
ncbi:MAG: lipoyl protein ligase domain-containing protein, partial [Actinomycetes bacterium]